MDGIWRILTLCFVTVLAISSFAVGVPLSYAFANRLRLSTFGNGVLLGAALGVIIPELVSSSYIQFDFLEPGKPRRGIEALSTSSGTPPTSKIALSLLTGFAVMLVIGQYLVPHSSPSISSPPPGVSYQTSPLAEEQMDFNMQPMDVESSLLPPTMPATTNGRYTGSPGPPPERILLPSAYIVIHSVADGLALGASAAGEDSSDMSLSLVVFFALILRKSPTALAFTSSLLTTSLPRIFEEVYTAHRTMRDSTSGVPLSHGNFECRATR